MTALSPAETSYIITGLSSSSPTRLDGRQLLEPRSIDISYGAAAQAYGSARVVIGGGTEVIAGIKLEVVDVPAQTMWKGKGRASEGWRTIVEVDVTPQAYPHLSSQALTKMSAEFASMIADHFVPSIPALPIVLPRIYFQPTLHLTLISASSASVPSTLLLAARAAFNDLRIPRTKRIGWGLPKGKSGGMTGNDADDGDTDMSGIKAAVRAGKGKRGRGRAVVQGGDDWELDNSGGGVYELPRKETLPVMVTLNLVPGSEAIFLDATTREESACPDRFHLFFKPSGKICGMRLEGDSGLPIGRLRALLLQGRQIASELIKSFD